MTRPVPDTLEARIVWVSGAVNSVAVHAPSRRCCPLLQKGQVVRIDVASGATAVVADGFGYPVAAKLNPNGDLFVVDQATGQVLRVDRHTGAKVVLVTATALGDPLPEPTVSERSKLPAGEQQHALQYLIHRDQGTIGCPLLTQDARRPSRPCWSHQGSHDAEPAGRRN